MDKKQPSEKTKLRCNLCGKRFKKGGTRYRINLEVISDFDGYIQDTTNKPDDYLQKKIEAVLEETKQMTEEELEEEVYLKRNWLVCVSCREKFLRTLKRLSE
jgi:PHP family Zn ribbon phosphoesterase